MTPSEFKAWFPDGEFDSLSDSYIQGFITRSATMFNTTRWGDLYEEGLANFVADRIVQSKARAARGITSMNSGAVTSKRVGPVSISYDSTIAQKQAEDTLLATDYGRRYCELRDMVGLGGMTATGDSLLDTESAS